jgi:tryptophan 2,3-dioxygenase
MTDIQPLPPLDPTMDASKNHYWSYHDLDTLLACKRPLTAARDEDLFITVHQICELAFNQMIIDMDRAIDAFETALDSDGDGIGDTTDAVYFLGRVNELWGTVNTTMPILKGMRAFAEFRTSIGPTSGFQSAQFRQIEIMSGIREIYWEGGTADAEGNKHVAETEFDRRHGDAVRGWFETYADRSLKKLAARLADRLGDTIHSDADAKPLVAALVDYDKAQLAFHRLHVGLATAQLRKVGVEIGTGGTDFRTYLTKYERTNAPLFPMLAQP